MRRPFALPGLAAFLLAAAVAPLSAHAQVPQDEAHKHLATEVGEWDAEVKMWHSADAEPMASKGSETNGMFGDFWLLSKFETDIAGMKYAGRMQLGYDPQKKKYVGTWIDTMSPYLSTMEGTYDEKTKTSTMIATGVDVMTGKPTASKMTTRIESEDEKVFEMFMPVEGKKDEWWKSMEIRYTRKK